MTSDKAFKILRAHNKWRRGGKGKMTDPTLLGEAIDVVCQYQNDTNKAISELKDIHVWATFDDGIMLDPKHVAKLTEKALKPFNQETT
jgi:hypothetical protein